MNFLFDGILAGVSGAKFGSPTSSAAVAFTYPSADEKDGTEPTNDATESSTDQFVIAESVTEAKYSDVASKMMVCFSCS